MEIEACQTLLKLIKDARIRPWGRGDVVACLDIPLAKLRLIQLASEGLARAERRFRLIMKIFNQRTSHFSVSVVTFF